MKSKLIASAGLLWGSLAMASPPVEVRIDSGGQFDINRIYSGAFSASGGFNTQGTVTDSPRFTGQAIHVMRTIVTSDRESVVFELNANHVKGWNVVPNWCAPPATIPSGTVLVPESGNWKVLSGTGKYAPLQGTGSWAAWVVVDPVQGLPVSATDCMAGKLQLD
jgi:hypothetical protein